MVLAIVSIHWISKEYICQKISSILLNVSVSYYHIISLGKSSCSIKCKCDPRSKDNMLNHWIHICRLCFTQRAYIFLGN